MKRPAVDAAATRPAHHHRQADVLAIAALGGVVGNHVESARDKIDELHLGHRAQAHHRCAAGRADDGALGDRRVDDALFAELFEKAVGHLKGATINANVFAEDEDALVALHLFP